MIDDVSIKIGNEVHNIKNTLTSREGKVVLSGPMHKLSEVIAYRKEFITIDDLTEYKRPRVQLHAQGIVLRDKVEGALIKTKKQQLCREGDLLVAEIDAKVGGFGIVPDELDGAIVSSHYYLYTIDTEKIDRAYLGYFIRTPMFRDQVEAQGSTNYAAIRPAEVLSYRIPLPSMSEQQRIVAAIEEIEKLRELQARSFEASDLLLQSVLHQAFGDGF